MNTIFHSFFIFLLFFPSLVTAAVQVNNLSSLENLKPGEKSQVKIVLINDGDTKEQVDLKLVNYSCNSEGQHFFDEENPSDKETKYPRSSINWIELSKNHLTLEPKETQDFYYTIKVPNDDNLKGSYWSVLLIEPLGTSPSKDPNNDGFQLEVKIRYAHHTIINIGEATPKLKILKKEIKEIEGNRYLCLHVINEGNLFFDPSLTLKLYDKEGKLEKTLESAPERLYPNNSQCFYLNLKETKEKDLLDKLTGFILFNDNNNILFGDKFTYP